MGTARKKDAELARGGLRITHLERQEIEKSGDAAKSLRAQLDRYQSWVLTFASVIWTADSIGALEGEQPSWSAYTGQTSKELQGNGWLDAIHPRCQATRKLTPKRH
jgi:PAS domain-containing protein